MSFIGTGFRKPQTLNERSCVTDIKTRDARHPMFRMTSVAKDSALNQDCLSSHCERLITNGNGTLPDAARRAAYVNRHLPHT
jgi:hypothetical protein